MATKSVCHLRGRRAALLAPVILALSAATAGAAPPIRTGSTNQVPACVTPERLMAFIGERNGILAPRYREIARWYKYYGEGWRVRWDYAFFQMAIETNFLSFRRGDGRRGDVSEVQNNFAGIGATGGGAPGERFPDVATGVHAQIQHLVAYSGERLAAPIAKRTRDRQDDIVEASQRLGRPVTFGDLARRWAVDRAYGKSIDFVADLYRSRYCAERPTRAAEELRPPPPQPARREWRYPFRPPSGLGGPKPLKLAGPQSDPPPEAGEVLPWLATPVLPPPSSQGKRPAAAIPVKPAGKTKRASKPSSKVRTIWSRGDVSDKKGAAQNPALPPAANAWGDVTVVRQGSATRAAPPSTDADTPALPTFRIAPVAAEASRLGGPLPADLGAPSPMPSTSPPAPCRVLSASYGGTKTLLIRSTAAGETHFTALTVIDGFEKSMFDAYARAQATRADIIGEYANRDAALADARVNCPGG